MTAVRDDGLRPSRRRPRLPIGAATVPAALAAAAARRPTADALLSRHERLSYAELDDRVRRAASVLATSGIGRADRVAASMGNHCELVVAFLATMHLGAIWVGVNRSLTVPEQCYVLGDSGASLFVGDRSTTDAVNAVRSALPDLRTVLDAEPGDPASAWAVSVAAAETSAPSPPVDPFDPAAIAYTSGTTGQPKGVVHSQHNMLLVSACAIGARPEAERIGVLLPLTILNLMILGPVTALQLGAAVVCIDRVDPVGLAAWIRDEQVSTLAAVPAIIHDLLTDPDVQADDLASLVRPGCGGGATPDGFRRLYEHRFGTRLTTSYGLTEAPTAVTIEDAAQPAVPGASGRSLPHVEVTVRDDRGRGVEPGTVGEVCVGPASDGVFAGAYTPMLGYWRRPEATRDALRDDVLHTGDLGYLTPDGDLFITDRKGDLIVRGGANVYPAEVERVLYDEPRVVACAVVGVPDERLGERVVAAVVAAPGARITDDELRTHCRTSLARYKVPERFLFVDDLPRNAMGKVVKRLVVPWFVEALP
jgi:long-chain acyl-CoA synthetase